VKTLTKPQLTPETIADDAALTDAIPNALRSPKLVPFTTEVLRRQRTLRELLTDEQARVYFALEEAVNDRVAAECIVLLRWAWREGRRVGRREGPRGGGGRR